MSDKVFYRNQWTQLFLIFAVFFIASVLTPAEIGSPEELYLWGIKLPPLCVSKLFFETPCPGCGLTRSFTAFTHFQFSNAFYFNLIGPIFAIILILEIPLRVYLLIKGPSVLTTKMQDIISYPSISCAFLMIIVWIIKRLLIFWA